MKTNTLTFVHIEFAFLKERLQAVFLILIYIFYILGNPLKCDCTVRPLKHYLLRQSILPPEYENLNCQEPKHVANQVLANIPDGHLNCVNGSLPQVTNMTQAEYDKLFQMQPDLKFRYIQL